MNTAMQKAMCSILCIVQYEPAVKISVQYIKTVCIIIEMPGNQQM